MSGGGKKDKGNKEQRKKSKLNPKEKKKQKKGGIWKHKKYKNTFKSKYVVGFARWRPPISP